MNLNIVGRHLHVTPAVRKYITNKVNKVTRYFKDVVTATVRLTPHHVERKKTCPMAEVTVHVKGPNAAKGKDIVVQTTDDNLYKAINDVFSALTRQVLKYKAVRLIPRRKKRESVTDIDV